MWLVGDFVPGRAEFAVPDFENELVLANLEGPVCRGGSRPIDKVGPHLYSEPFKLSGRWAFTLANNHLMDFCTEGMRESFAFLRTGGYPFAGAGEDVRTARAPMLCDENGKRIAIICCCERQFGAAGDHSPGVAALGDWVDDAVKGLKSGVADFVIVSCHAGSESSKYVSPNLRRLYHRWVDAGADVIHGHHAHIPQGWETYRGKPIFYGLGNFVIDPTRWVEMRDYHWSLTVRVDFGETLTWEIKPYGKVPADWGTYVEDANRGFADENLLERRWKENCKEQYERYYRPYLGLGLKSVAKWLLSPRKMRLLRQNFSHCETHIDIIKTARGCYS